MARHRTTGYGQVIDDLGAREFETFTCVHCNTIHDVLPREEIAMCHRCWAPVCTSCHASGECAPFEKKLVAYERGMHAARQRNSLLAACGL